MIGFIGVGTMGGPIARNLIRAGKDVLIFDFSTDNVARTLAAGPARQAAAREELAACDIIFTCLPLPRHVMDVMLGESGLYSRMSPGAVHVDLSTIDPASARTLAAAAENAHLAYIQCTLGKTPAHAEKAEEPLFIGGNQEAIARLNELWPVIGVFNNVGTIEAACAVKLISNLIGMTNLAVLAEGMNIGRAAGLEDKQLLELLGDTGARSFQLDVRGPWMAAQDYAVRFGGDLALKDVRLGCEMARTFGLDARLMETALTYFQEASVAGYGREDCDAVIKVAAPSSAAH